jgi:hypothetical protein
MLTARTSIFCAQDRSRHSSRSIFSPLNIDLQAAEHRSSGLSRSILRPLNMNIQPSEYPSRDAEYRSCGLHQFRNTSRVCNHSGDRIDVDAHEHRHGEVESAVRANSRSFLELPRINRRSRQFRRRSASICVMTGLNLLVQRFIIDLHGRNLIRYSSPFRNRKKLRVSISLSPASLGPPILRLFPVWRGAPPRRGKGSASIPRFRSRACAVRRDRTCRRRTAYCPCRGRSWSRLRAEQRQLRAGDSFALLRWRRGDRRRLPPPIS